MSSCWWHSWVSLQLWAMSPRGLVQEWMLALDARVEEFPGSLWGGRELKYVSAVHTIPILHQWSRASHSVPYSPSLQRYSPTKSTAVTPLQRSQWKVCKSLLLPPRWQPVRDRFHPPPVLLSSQHLKPPAHDESDRPNLVHHKLYSGQSWNWILVPWNPVIYWLTHWMSIQQPDFLLKILLLKVIVNCVMNSA